MNVREWTYHKEGAVKISSSNYPLHPSGYDVRDWQFYSSAVLNKIFKVSVLTLTKLLSGRKYIGGAELEKYCKEMTQKGINIVKCKEKKTRECQVSEQPMDKQQQEGTSSGVMEH